MFELLEKVQCNERSDGSKSTEWYNQQKLRKNVRVVYDESSNTKLYVYKDCFCDPLQGNIWQMKSPRDAIKGDKLVTLSAKDIASGIYTELDFIKKVRELKNFDLKNYKHKKHPVALSRDSKKEVEEYLEHTISRYYIDIDHVNIEFTYTFPKISVFFKNITNEHITFLNDTEFGYRELKNSDLQSRTNTIYRILLPFLTPQS